MDMKNTLELIELGRVAGVTVSEVLEDGKVGITDLPKLVKLIAPLKNAIEGLNLLVDEVKDIDAEEAKTVLEAVVNMTAAWAPIFTKKA